MNFNDNVKNNSSKKTIKKIIFSFYYFNYSNFEQNYNEQQFYDNVNDFLKYK